MKIKAKFKGSDSLGYVNGKNYVLDFKLDTWERKEVIEIREIIKEDAPCTMTIRTDSYCPYSSLKAFLNNWQVF